MKKYGIVAILLELLVVSYCLQEQNLPEQNKTKRGIVEDNYFYKGPTLVKILQNQDSTTAGNVPSVKNLYDPMKQAQQALYEYQQTPQTTNVHYNQQFHSLPGYQSDSDQSQSPNTHFINQHHLLQVEPNQYNVVQHGAVIQHHQNYPKILPQPTNHPLNLQQPQKYLYVNGRIVYYPSGTPTLTRTTPYPGIALQVRPHNIQYNQYHPSYGTQKPFRPSPVITNSYVNRYTIPTTNVKKVETPVKEPEEEKIEEERADTKEENEEEDESEVEDHHESDEDSDEDHHDFDSEKYRFGDDEEEEDDHSNYRNDDEEEDEETDGTKHYSTRQVRRNPTKKRKSNDKPLKYHHDSYKYSEGYSKKNSDTSNKGNKKRKGPKTQYQTYKYYKSASNIVPKIEKFEAHEAKVNPLVHKQKIYRKSKWIVRNSSDSTN